MINFKIQVTPEQSKMVQRMIFKVGGSWAEPLGKNILEDVPFIYYSDEKRLLTFSDFEQEWRFKLHEFKEITFTKFLKLIVSEYKKKSINNK